MVVKFRTMSNVSTGASGGAARPKHRRKWIAAVLAVVLALLLTEAALRLFDYPADYKPSFERLDAEWNRHIHRPSPIPGLAYELAPNVDRQMFGVRIRTNSFGMRGPEFSPQKPGGVHRVIALGDSITFGWKVEATEAWPGRLEQMLNAGGGGFEVLNMGVSGYNTREEVTLFLDRGQTFDPDLVVVGYCLNDPENEPVQPLSAFYQPPSWWKHSNLLRLLWKAVWSMRVRYYGGGDYHLYLHRYPPAWNTVMNSFARLGLWSREHKVPVLVAIFPDLSRPAAGYPYAQVHEQIANEARASGLMVLDLRAAFDPHPRELMRISADDPHPSVAGQRVAAAAILDAVLGLKPDWFH